MTPLLLATLIYGARIADGTGAPLRKADVRIEGDRIAAIGKLRLKPGEPAVNGRGLILAPGFIDPHNHSTDLDADPAAASQVSQGITTILVGQDGSSPWPIGGYLKRRAERPAAVNVKVLAGHATIRRLIMGADFRRAARPGEIAAMERLVEQAMREGAIGLSSGLEYEVGSYATTEEVVSLARIAGRHGGIYVSHVRDEGDGVFASLREIIRIGREARLPVQITHIKLATAAVWGRAAEAVKMIEAARASGLDITADCYPYDAWSSGISVLVARDRQHDPAAIAKGLADVGGPASVTITKSKAHPEYEFRNLEQIAAAKRVTAVELYSEMVTEGGATVVVRAMKDADIRLFYQQPWVMVGSDGGIGMRHPRGAGTYPRVLGLFVRERHWLSLPEAIRKMTSFPAARLGLADRGSIRVGMKADLALFDPARVTDRATFADPLKLSDGIAKVWVNGVVVWSKK